MLTATLSKLLESLIDRKLLPKVVDKLDSKQFGALRTERHMHWPPSLLCGSRHRTFTWQSERYSLIIARHLTTLTIQECYQKWPHLKLTIRWMHSFLSNREQRVEIESTLSQWTTLNGGMPQWTWFGPYVFLMLTDDLHTMIDTFKSVDDVTLCKVVTDSSISQMQVAACQTVHWSNQHMINTNAMKTKEILFIVGPNSVRSTINCCQRWHGWKRANNLSWEEHITNVCNKTNKRLHYLKLLKRCLASADDQLQYYKSVIQPTVEYACPIWQSELTNEQPHRVDRFSGAQLNWFQLATMNCTVLFITLNRLQLDLTT